MAVTKKKDSSLLVKINAEDKKKFIELCEEQDTSASREVRHFIRRYRKKLMAALDGFAGQVHSRAYPCEFILPGGNGHRTAGLSQLRRAYRRGF